jgi:hypothetical protein
MNCCLAGWIYSPRTQEFRECKFSGLFARGEVDPTLDHEEDGALIIHRGE